MLTAQAIGTQRGVLPLKQGPLVPRPCKSSLNSIVSRAVQEKSDDVPPVSTIAQKSAGALLGALAAASLVLSSAPSSALAKPTPSLATRTQDSAAEMHSILASHGAALPVLQSSPSMSGSSAAVAQPTTESEVLRELRRESKENERLRAELQASQRAITSGSASRVATAAVAAPSSPPAPSVVVAAPSASTTSTTPPARETEESSTNGFSVLNIFGIVAAGVLGGYLTIQKKEATEVEAEFQSKLKTEQGTISGLQTQVAEVEAAVARERELAEKIRREASTAASEATRKIELEKEAAAAVAREKAFVERTLQTEQRLAETMRREAEATAEALAAERAAKFAADAEAQELQRQVEQVNAALEEEKSLTTRLEGESAKVKHDLRVAVQSNTALTESNAALTADVAAEQQRVAALAAKSSELESDLESAHAAAAQQADLVDRIGKQTLSMREAMQVMKNQSAERALAAHAAATAAAAEREQASTAYAEAQVQLAEGRYQICSLQEDLEETKQQLVRAAHEVERTKEELGAARIESEKLKNQVAALRDRAAAAEAAFGREQQAASGARTETVAVRSELATVQSQLTKLASSLSLERAEKEELANAVEELRTQYEAAAERVEAEQTTVIGLRRESGDLKRALSELETKNKTLATNLQQTDASYRQKLAETSAAVQEAQGIAEERRVAQEDATAAVIKMESIIRGAQAEMATNQAAAEEARLALAAERAARVEAEESTAVLQNELAAITAAESRARAGAQEQLLALQAEYELAKTKLAELQVAKPKRAPRAAKVVVDDDNGNGAAGVDETVDAAPKRRGRPKKVVAADADA